MTGTYCGVVVRCKSYGDVRYCKERDLTRDLLTFVPLYIFGTLLNSPLDLEVQDSSLAISFWWFQRFRNVVFVRAYVKWIKFLMGAKEYFFCYK